MKIGLLTIYQVPNYGSVLQAYATQELLKSMGHDAKIIRYDYFNKRYYKARGFGPSLRERFYPFKALLLPKCKSAVLQRFRYKNLNFTKSFSNIKSLEEYDWSDYDAFVVGSDQVWNTTFLYGDPVFLLQFVPSNKKRLSLSSSFATSAIPDKYKDIFRRELSKFSAISVRENNGVDIINKQLGINTPVKVTLDPTLLLSKSQWQELFPLTQEKKLKKPYILYYMWSYAFEPRPYIFDVVKHFQQKTGWDVVALEGIRDSSDARGIDFIDADNSTIPEFIDLFNNASLVITSSFHGTAFAINFGIPLLSVVPDGAGDDRQSTILKACGADNCITKIGSDIEKINPEYDKQAVSAKLEKLRADSINWINNNITI